VLTGLSAHPTAIVQSERLCDGMRKAGYRRVKRNAKFLSRLCSLPISAKGHQRRFGDVRVVSAYPPRATKSRTSWHFGFGSIVLRVVGTGICRSNAL
jgi:hypothetical protein